VVTLHNVERHGPDAQSRAYFAPLRPPLSLLNTLPFDHKSGSPESLLGLLPDINKPPIEGEWSALSYLDRIVAAAGTEVVSTGVPDQPVVPS